MANGTRCSRRVSIPVALAALACLPGTLTPAAAEVTYDVTAAADGVRISVVAEDFLVVPDLLDVGLPSAHAKANSSFGGQGFAGNPYPGETVVSVPDLLSGAIQENTGQDVEVPRSPLYVSSRHPTRGDDKVAQPGYTLTSHSDESSAEAEATMGLSSDAGSVARVVARARSDADPNADTATATSTSDVQGLTINDALQLGRVRSTATVKAGPDGKVHRSSDLAIADTRVAGTRVAITPKGVEAADESIAAPSPEQLNEVLEQAGISVRYLAPEETPTGVVSAGVEVTARQPDPTGSSNVTFVVRYVFGRSSAAAGGSADEFDSDFSGPLDSDNATGSGADSATSGPAAPEPAAPESASPEVAAPTVADGPTPAAAPPPAVAAEQPVAEQTRLLGWPGDLGGVGIYLTVVFVALVTLVGGTLVRLLGVRTRWVS